LAVTLGLNDITSVATTAGVLVGVYQLVQARRSLREAFERTFVERYQSVVARIELDVLLGNRLPDLDDSDLRRAFFEYFELCEEELYYRSFRRVTRSTWRAWWYGMDLHFRNPAFAAAFEAICRQSGTGADGEEHPRFSFLRHAYAQRRQGEPYEPERQRLLRRIR
jgi:hypothetical protein